jgi:hypothetical protein
MPLRWQLATAARWQVGFRLCRGEYDGLACAAAAALGGVSVQEEDDDEEREDEDDHDDESDEDADERRARLSKKGGLLGLVARIFRVGFVGRRRRRHS